jgi:hypothetical protein
MADQKGADSEEAAREELRAIARELEEIGGRLDEIHDELPVPPNVTGMLLEEEEMDAATEMRSAIECVLQDNLRPAIRDLRAAADYQPGQRGA